MSRPAAGKTLRLTAAGLSDLSPHSVYVVSAVGTEPRGRAPVWDLCIQNRRSNCLEAIGWDENSLTARRGTGEEATVALNDEPGILGLFNGSTSAYIDISGLPHHVWAPLLRTALKHLTEVRVVYTEPSEYKKHPNPTSRTEFDLSAGFRGIAPIPGFAKLKGPDDEKDAVLVALLGFEGRRASHVAMELDPVPRVFAIVGVPGFRVEYPQVTHANNIDFLAAYRAHADVRFASASCPFETFDALLEIQRDCPGKYMYLAPIGTKPHALGAICFALKYPEQTEIMYDHPTRKPGRTSGIGLLHIYTLKPSYVAP